MMYKLRRYLLQVGKVLAILAMIGILYVYAMFQGGFVSWFLLYSVCVALIINSLLSFYPLRFFKVDRTLSKEVTHADEKVDVTLSLKKKSPFPVVFVGLWDELPSGLSVQMEEQPGTIYFFPSSKRTRYTYQIQGKTRGEYTFSAVTLAKSDLFGLFHQEFLYKTSTTLTILPKMRPLHQWATFYNMDGDEVPLSSTLLSEAVSIAGVRDYVAGDRLSSIDWKVTARTGKLVTKEFETRVGNGCLLVLEDTAYSSLPSLERSIEFCASFLNASFSESTPLSFALTSRSSPVTELGTERKHYEQILKELARVESSLSSFQLKDLLHHTHAIDSIVYVTSQFTLKERRKIDALLPDYKRFVLIYVNGGEQDQRDLPELEALKNQGANVFIVRLDDGAFTSLSEEEVSL